MAYKNAALTADDIGLEMQKLGAPVVVKYEFCSLDEVADLAAEFADPFHIVAQREQEMGYPLALQSEAR